MKSQLSKFKLVKDQPLSEILKALNLTEAQLLRLMRMWVEQGHIERKDPLFSQLKEQQRLARQQQINNRHIRELKKYQNLRNQGLNLDQTAQSLHYSRYKMEHFLMKNFQRMHQQHLNDTLIANALYIPLQDVLTMKRDFLEAEQMKAEAFKRKLQHNQLYAQRHLQGIKNDLLHNTQNYLIFDIEAIQCPDEPIEISIIDCHEQVIFDSLIQPENKINWRIAKLTGITDEMVQNQPSISEVMPVIKKLTAGKTMLSWGSDYDSILLKTAMEQTGVFLDCNWGCAQHIHMGIVGSPNQIALGTAAGASTQSHRALDDCKMVLSILKRDLEEMADAVSVSVECESCQ